MSQAVKSALASALTYIVWRAIFTKIQIRVKAAFKKTLKRVTILSRTEVQSR